MTTWILLIIMHGRVTRATGSAIGSAVFQSQASCEKAAEQIRSDKESRENLFNVYCFENAPAK